MIDKSKFKGTPIALIYKDIVIDQFTILKKYVANFYEHNIDRKGVIENFIKEDIPQDIMDTLIEDHSTHSQFDQILYQSLVILTYSNLEYWLRKIALYLDTQDVIMMELKQQKGNDIEKSTKVISKLANVNFSPKASEWDEILDFAIIRNAIVHNTANVYDHQIKKTDIKDFTGKEQSRVRVIKKNNRLSWEKDSGEIKISDLNYSLRFANLSMNYLLFTLDEIVKYISSNTKMN